MSLNMDENNTDSKDNKMIIDLKKTRMSVKTTGMRGSISSANIQGNRHRSLRNLIKIASSKALVVEKVEKTPSPI